MKKLSILFFSFLFLLSSCATMKSLDDKMMKITEGMSQKEVKEIFGAPNFRRFDNGREEWEYSYTTVITDTKIFLIRFESGRVVGMDTFVVPYEPNRENTFVR
ncbi:outer membrane protein assembly factor BamE domain-containing protein [Bacteroides ihuae]|uniref:outer membrane protein assembly factor BamE domain-containing protein n=1 Tax=Bacteroides ihuae TaxID=1852362 RepID=UPI0008DA30F6|nr:outer membrane protein assembly factor BamE [Bacteroides ihuae]